MSMLIAHESMQIDGMERRDFGKFKSGHDHARDPEEQNIIACFHVGSWIKIFQIGRLLRPAQSGEGPKSRREPCIQHIIILMDFLRAACCTLSRIFTCHGHVVIGAIPNGDAMSPPELATDTPIFDIVEPVVINLFKTLGHDLDLSVAYRVETFARERFHFHEPLLRDHRLDNFTAAL